MDGGVLCEPGAEAYTSMDGGVLCEPGAEAKPQGHFFIFNQMQSLKLFFLGGLAVCVP
ncbi:hypothetical protein GCM10023308_07420 [Marinicella pacifica]